MPDDVKTEDNNAQTFDYEPEPDGFIPMPGQEEETPTSDTPAAEPSAKPEPEPEPDTDPKPDTDPEPETPKFEFVEEGVQDTPTSEEAQPFIVIKHNGNEIPIADEQTARNLIQKGFDYEYKVGPHGKLAQIMNQYPAFAKIVGNEWNKFVDVLQGKDPVEEPRAEPKAEAKKPTLKNIADYEDANEWFWDNYAAVKDYENSQKPDVKETPVQERPNQPEQIPSHIQALMTHDPTGWQSVAPELMPMARKYLTVEQYHKVNTSLPHLVQFYDWVRGQVVKKTTTPTPEPEPTKNVEDPSFRIKSGGGEAPDVDEEKPPWEAKNNEEFEEYMAKVKGVAYYK